ncbi:hypothetical protein BDV96DRAFT_671099 [Lophiotrema nucula]|uniref:Uncharacterized protein n=1 Tax=Lophiotrema nucula TaxID=690887 RepID=A0A6A5YMQ0_9PLEO|nr:hypothetical protein BDV96DRAFT_671099 [Lophiotrema nucula]
MSRNRFIVEPKSVSLRRLQIRRKLLLAQCHDLEQEIISTAIMKRRTLKLMRRLDSCQASLQEVEDTLSSVILVLAQMSRIELTEKVYATFPRELRIMVYTHLVDTHLIECIGDQIKRRHEHEPASLPKTDHLRRQWWMREEAPLMLPYLKNLAFAPSMAFDEMIAHVAEAYSRKHIFLFIPGNLPAFLGSFAMHSNVPAPAFFKDIGIRVDIGAIVTRARQRGCHACELCANPINVARRLGECLLQIPSKSDRTLQITLRQQGLGRGTLRDAKRELAPFIVLLKRKDFDSVVVNWVDATLSGSWPLDLLGCECLDRINICLTLSKTLPMYAECTTTVQHGFQPPKMVVSDAYPNARDEIASMRTTTKLRAKLPGELRNAIYTYLLDVDVMEQIKNSPTGLPHFLGAASMDALVLDEVVNLAATLHRRKDHERKPTPPCDSRPIEHWFTPKNLPHFLSARAFSSNIPISAFFQDILIYISIGSIMSKARYRRTKCTRCSDFLSITAGVREQLLAIEPYSPNVMVQIKILMRGLSRNMPRTVISELEPAFAALKGRAFKDVKVDDWGMRRPPGRPPIVLDCECQSHQEILESVSLGSMCSRLGPRGKLA